jgi:hypothetical protein
MLEVGGRANAQDGRRANASTSNRQGWTDERTLQRVNAGGRQTRERLDDRTPETNGGVNTTTSEHRKRAGERTVGKVKPEAGGYGQKIDTGDRQMSEHLTSERRRRTDEMHRQANNSTSERRGYIRNRTFRRVKPSTSKHQKWAGGRTLGRTNVRDKMVATRFLK